MNEYPCSAQDILRLRAFVDAHPRLVILTGAGCSTESGIPDYRDALGAWKRSPPVQFQDFMSSEQARRRYWSRSMLGFPLMDAARPNAAHGWVASLQQAGRVQLLVTQNVDGLHQRAGSRQVVDLHGRIHQVLCMSCGMRLERRLLQERLESLNPEVQRLSATIGADGDADLNDVELDGFRLPSCDSCGGILKPDVVFFGENVPRPRVDQVFAAIRSADALLVLGSSLKLYSGFRFCREAAQRALPVAAVNLGVTRADDLLTLKLEAPCAAVCAALTDSGDHWAA
ncbi:MAG: NAD-dependent protein deacetylase [Gammaproteobacteria bacterium]|nr:NAD-dependent protein deacetylase [Gammaproteobacteria bacterium]